MAQFDPNRQQHEPIDAVLVESAYNRSSGSVWIIAVGLAIAAISLVGFGIFLAGQWTQKSVPNQVTITAEPTELEQQRSSDNQGKDPSLPPAHRNDVNAEAEDSTPSVEAEPPKERLSIALKRGLDSIKVPVDDSQEGEDPAGKTISLLKLLPDRPLMAGGAAPGVWEVTDAKLRGLDAGILLPIDPPHDYQLDITVDHLRADGHLLIGFPVVESRANVILDWEVDGETVSGIDCLDQKGANKNGTTYHGRVIQEGTPTHLRLRVRGNHIQLTADGKSIVDWTGDPRRLVVGNYWGVPGERPVFLALTGEVGISKLEFTPYLKDSVPPAGPAKFELAYGIKHPAPKGNELAKARAAARKLFEEELASSDNDWSRRQLAEEMRSKAYFGTDDPNLVYGLLYEAFELASTSGNADMAGRYARNRGDWFDIDHYPLQVLAYQRCISDVTAETDDDRVRSLVTGISLDYDEALQAERFDIALQLANLLKKLNARKRLPELKRFVDRRVAEGTLTNDLLNAASVYRNANGETLQTPQAKLAIGRYLCFAAGHWDEGLPLLTESSDEGLAAVARLELRGDPREDRAIADGWYGLAQKATGPWKNEYLRQARYWFEQSPADTAERSEIATKIDGSVGVAKNRLKPGIVSAHYSRINQGLLRKTNTLDHLYYNFGYGSADASVPKDDFMSVWTGYIQAHVPGKYRLIVSSDDGSRLKLDGVTLWDEITASAGQRSHEVDLTGEPQLLEVSHHDLGLQSYCALQWTPIEYDEPQTIQQHAFSHDVRFAKKMQAGRVLASFFRTVRVAREGGSLYAFFEDYPALETKLTEGAGYLSLDHFDRYSGQVAFCVSHDSRYGVNTFSTGETVAIRQNPQEGEYRYIRFAWKKPAKTPFGIQIFVETLPGVEPPFKDWKRFHAGPAANEFPTGGPSIQVSEEVPAEWTVVTRDLAKDFGEVNIVGLALSACDENFALFDHIYLARTLEDFDKLGKVNAPAEQPKSE